MMGAVSSLCHIVSSRLLGVGTYVSRLVARLACVTAQFSHNIITIEKFHLTLIIYSEAAALASWSSQILFNNLII